ncbi:hypothetical protein Cgig2_022845 [Carnegiea gigantea]|uniref:C3H1-type domain-containing protein n=1 Tax=Carnegiea gigantea TaxID=171969 RepID=A0A9Q1KMA1_9CARY|nr:hypothetical protein Cgig2_022845 [Carnegiea gigantea]
MPVGKYYCDYCDKEFQDTPAARKRHLQGVQHHRNRALWYDSLRHQDPNQIPLNPQAFGKGFCNRFLKAGFCPYGDSCKYQHPKQNLQGQIAQGTPGCALSQSFGMSLGNLPPSLRPPPEGGYPSLPFVMQLANVLMSLGNLLPLLRPPEGVYPSLSLLTVAELVRGFGPKDLDSSKSSHKDNALICDALEVEASALANPRSNVRESSFNYAHVCNLPKLCSVIEESICIPEAFVSAVRTQQVRKRAPFLSLFLAWFPLLICAYEAQ